MTSIFVIEQGKYSDYRVVGVFSTKANAELVAARINADDPYEKATVAEWPLDPAVDALNQGLSRFRVVMRKDGATESVKRGSVDSYLLADSFREWERERAAAYRDKGVPNALDADVWAEDEKHAIKIVNERRIQMLALGQWKGKL